jgi:hypothetical protein
MNITAKLWGHQIFSGDPIYCSLFYKCQSREGRPPGA